MTPNLPDRVSDAGPDPVEDEYEYDWRDYLDFARDEIWAAERAERLEAGTAAEVHHDRIAAIDDAITMLQKAKEYLCR
jgi:hypothetical protein